MQITDQKKFIFLIGILLIAVILIFVLLNRLWDFEGRSDLLVEEPGVPEQDLQRVIERETSDGLQIITNRYDGYRVSVPSTWIVSDEIRSGLFGLVMIYEEGEHEDEVTAHPYTDEGLVMNVFVFENEDNLSINDWLSVPERTRGFFEGDNFTQETHEEYNLYTTRRQFTQEIWLGGEEFTDEPIEDTLSVKYVLKSPNANKIYVLTCSIFNDVEDLLPECEKLLPGFEIL